MINSGSLENLNVPQDETSWFTTRFEGLSYAARAILLFATALASVAASDPVGAQPAQEHPNILVIMADDIG